MPATLAASVNHLLSLVGKGKNENFNPEQAKAVIDFVANGKDSSALHYPDSIDNTTAAYHEFEIDSDLPRLVNYVYNPEIPAQTLSPSSLRSVRLLPGDDGRLPSWQWKKPGELTSPQIVKFAEHEEVTPDINTGAYYGYDLDRTLVFYRHQGRTIFLSLSRQRDISDVGKKGLALGANDDWDFLYSDEQGLMLSGLGWVKSYMYRSFSITVYVEEEGGSPKTRCGVFKWLNAGWAGLNMVKREHIYHGIDRYAVDLKKVLENRQLPPPSALASHLAALKKFGTDEVRRLMREYLDNLTAQYNKNEELPRPLFSDLLANARYLEKLNSTQMRAILELEYLKTVLGKPTRLPQLTAMVARQ